MDGLDGAMSALKQKEIQASVLRGKHLDLACSIYVKMLDKDTPAEMLAPLAANSVEAATVMFQQLGLIKK